MYAGKLVFAQVMEFAPWHTFRRLIKKHRGDFNVRSFSCLDQFLCMAFAQLTYRESLRDIEACLRAQASKLYHLGIRGNISRSALADANETRDWRIYYEFAQALIVIARRLYADEPLAVDLANTIYALDATTIDLCLSLFPWAPFRHTKAAIKLHTLLDLRGCDSQLHSHQRRETPRRQRARYSRSRGGRLLCHGPWLPRFRATVSAASGQMLLCHPRQVEHGRSARLLGHDGSIQGRHLRPDHRAEWFLQSATLPRTSASRPIQRPLESGKTLVFLTNHTGLPALTICALYNSRWAVELFFRWVKGHLRIKHFLGTSENAVKTQVWIAVATYVLIAIVRKRLKLDLSLHSMSQILSVTPFETIPLLQLLTDSVPIVETGHDNNQLNLF